MTILSTEMIFFGAQFPNDEAYGGGPMSATVVEDGVASNVFPVAGEADMASGRFQLRKVYAAVLSANQDLLVNASVGLYTPPVDGNYKVVMFRQGDARTTRNQAAAAIAGYTYGASSVGGGISGSSNPYTLTGGYGSLEVGDRIILGVPGTDINDGNIPFTLTNVATVQARTGASVTLELLAEGGSLAFSQWSKASPHPTTPQMHGASFTTASAAAAATTIQLNNVQESLVPFVGGVMPDSMNGLTVGKLKWTGGLVPIFHAGGLAVIRNAAGSVSEVINILRVNFTDAQLELAAPLVNSYASGSYVYSLMPVGDLGSAMGISFSQQTWTRTFSDILIGNSIAANYDFVGHPLAMTNEGTETERWAIVFTSATDFKLIGERVGQIASGSTAAAFAPLNPITNQPYFTIAAAGWGTGWQAGNVLRFNTVGPRAPFWMARSIFPTPATPDDGVQIQFRGSY